MLDDFVGLGRRRRGLAATMTIFLLSLAGIPPLVGFAAKYYVFYAAVLGGHIELAVIGAVASVIGVFYYLRVIWVMYFIEPRAAAARPAASVAAGQSEGPILVPARSTAAGGVALAEPPPSSTPVAAISRTGSAASVASSHVAHVEPRVITPGTWLALAFCLLLTIIMGVLPGTVFQLAVQAASTLFH